MSAAALLMISLIATPPKVLDRPPSVVGPSLERVERRTITSAPWLPTQSEQVIEAPSRSKVAPAIAFGLSLAAGIVGAVFFVRTLDAIDAAPGMVGLGLGSPTAREAVQVPDVQAIKDQQEKVITNAVAGTVLMSASVAGLVTSTVLLVSD
jgi:hypothetical protein